MGEGDKTFKSGLEVEEGDIQSKKTDDNEHEKYQAHPMVWVPTSGIIAIIFAVGNVISSYLSSYGFKLREIHSPSTIICGVFLLGIISFDGKKGSHYSAKTHQSARYFDWFYEIFLQVEVKIIEEEQLSIHQLNSIDKENQSFLFSKTKKSIRWNIILLTIFVSILSIFMAWSIIVAFYYANLANLNSGVIMAAFSIKPVIISIAFSFLYKQKLKRFEIVGIAILMISVAMIAFSTDNIFEEGVTTNAWYTIGSLGLLMLGILGLTTTTVVLKHFLAYGDNQVNVSAYYNFYNMGVGVFGLILFCIDLSTNSEFKLSLFDFMISQSIGFLWCIAISLMAYVNLRGKAGTSDALIETSIVYQTILDAIIFGRIPNTIQIGGVVIAFVTSVLIVIGYQYDKKSE